MTCFSTFYNEDELLLETPVVDKDFDEEESFLAKFFFNSPSYPASNDFNDNEMKEVFYE